MRGAYFRHIEGGGGRQSAHCRCLIDVESILPFLFPRAPQVYRDILTTVRGVVHFQVYDDRVSQ